MINLYLKITFGKCPFLFQHDLKIRSHFMPVRHYTEFVCFWGSDLSEMWVNSNWKESTLSSLEDRFLQHAKYLNKPSDEIRAEFQDATSIHRVLYLFRHPKTSSNSTFFLNIFPQVLCNSEDLHMHFENLSLFFWGWGFYAVWRAASLLASYKRESDDISWTTTFHVFLIFPFFTVVVYLMPPPTFTCATSFCESAGGGTKVYTHGK